MTQVAGVDGCPKGWIAIVLEDGRFVRAERASTFTELLPQLTDARVIAVDIPIGLPDGPEPRKADVEARGLLGPRSSSVFTTPPRAVLEATTYRKANHLSKQRFDRGISAQSYALRPKIFQVDACAATDDRIYEVHPEVSFAAMGGAPLSHPKKVWNGLATRLLLLAENGIVVPANLQTAGAIPADDVIDAAAAAWSAMRIIEGRAERAGEPIPNGRPNRHAGFIWY